MAKPKKKPVSKKGTTEPQWKTVEKVVALLEKSLAPEARVRHNVKLPCLTTGHEEQCDVVIEMGQEPRVTRTIVEVQKRNERVKPNEFRGWCQKLRDVGANRLICVSAKPFPRSIKDKVAKELGPTVLLVRLEALEAKQWPFQIVNNAMKVYKSKVEVDSTIKPNPLLIFHPDQNPFQEYTGELFSAASLPNVIRREGHAGPIAVDGFGKRRRQVDEQAPRIDPSARRCVPSSDALESERCLVLFQRADCSDTGSQSRLHGRNPIHPFSV